METVIMTHLVTGVTGPPSFPAAYTNSTGATCPFDILPNEIIGNILTLASQPLHWREHRYCRNDFPSTALLVCKLWNAIVMSTPAAWIYPSMGPFSEPYWRRKIELHAKRRGGLPLHVDLKIYRGIQTTAHIMFGDSGLGWAFPPLGDPDAVASIRVFNHIADNLLNRTLLLYSLTDFRKNGWMNIVSLGFSGNGLDSYSHKETPLAALSAVLCRLPALRLLYLEGVMFNRTQSDYMPNIGRPIPILHSLEELRVYGSNHQTLSLLLAFKTPALKTLAFDCSAIPDDTDKHMAFFQPNVIPPEFVRHTVENVLLYNLPTFSDTLTILSSVPNTRNLAISSQEPVLDLKELGFGVQQQLCPELRGLTLHRATSSPLSLTEVQGLAESRLPTLKVLEVSMDHPSLVGEL
ncbi:hypothetical protein FRB95_012660 [Tulasnella sp. JGI-2019a]|nr:hypothetical protein FRB95_012660 [Tulasnella sp. JGI-2019a]